jgi:hypothetical protein
VAEQRRGSSNAETQVETDERTDHRAYDDRRAPDDDRRAPDDDRRAPDGDRRAHDGDRRRSAMQPSYGTGRHRTDDVAGRPGHVGVGPAPTISRSSTWGPVLSGGVTAFVIFLIFTALWVAIAASGAEAVGNNLEWFQLVSGIVAAAAGGAAAGWLDPRGAATGMIHGLATWGLLVLAVTITGVATGTALLGATAEVTAQAEAQVANVTELLQPFETELWALFAILFGGALIAALAGALTGRLHMNRIVDEETWLAEHRYDDDRRHANDRR